MPGTTFLRGDRVTLRTVERDDAEFVQRGHNDPDVRVPLGMTAPKNCSQIEDFVENDIEGDDSINLLVCLDDEPMGAVTVLNRHYDRPMLAYWLLPEYHGEGYATEAVGLLVDYVFESFDKHGLQAHAFAFNEGSRGVLERLGFTEEGRLREDRFVGGRYVDTVLYGLLRREWAEGRE